MSSAPQDFRGETPMRVFATTSWTLILSAQRGGSPDHTAALDRLCQTYWYPLYAYVRRRGHSHEDAQDLIQGFFAHFLDRDALAKAAPHKGKFRSFLLASLNYFLADARDRERAQKRGGGREVISLDGAEAEWRYRHEPAHHETPERLFERRWALALIEQVFRLLAQEGAEARGEVFRELRPFLAGEKAHGTYADAAARLGMTEAAVKMAVSRLRQRYRELMREAIAQTVAEPSEVEAELSDLFAALGS